MLRCQAVQYRHVGRAKPPYGYHDEVIKTEGFLEQTALAYCGGILIDPRGNLFNSDYFRAVGSRPMIAEARASPARNFMTCLSSPLSKIWWEHEVGRSGAMYKMTYKETSPPLFYQLTEGSAVRQGTSWTRWSSQHSCVGLSALLKTTEKPRAGIVTPSLLSVAWFAARRWRDTSPEQNSPDRPQKHKTTQGLMSHYHCPHRPCWLSQCCCPSSATCMSGTKGWDPFTDPWGRGIV